MHLHYDPSYIENNGEIRVHQEITRELMYTDEDWHIIYSLRLSNKYHSGQKSGECDFILLSKYGMVVLEVKGGVIEYSDNTFFQMKASNKDRRRIKPFIQVDQNAGALIGFLREKNFRNCFVARIVIFPECDFRYQGIGDDNFWHLGRQESQLEFIRNSLCEQKKDHKEKELKRLYLQLDKKPGDDYLTRRIQETKSAWSNLSENDIVGIVKSLLPNVKGISAKSKFIISKENAQYYSELNQAYLKGLCQNKRLMIQGPPGCGKSTYARELIEHHANGDESTGLFLCWNEFLAYSIKHELQQNPNLKIEVFPYYEFVQILIEKAELPANTLTYDNISKISVKLKMALDYLESTNTLPEYDYLVIDEAQDLFDRGLDQVIDHCQMEKNDIISGEYYIFYDNTQAFKNTIDYDQYNLVQDFLNDQSATFIMPVRFRTFGDKGIASFVDDIQQGEFNIQKDYGDSVEFIESAIDKIPLVLQNVRNRLIRETSCETSEMVILFTSNLISGSSEQTGVLDAELEQAEGFTKLSNTNLTSLPENTIGFTTMLKYKGLEKEIVILVTSDIQNKKQHILYQLYIGASRAKSRLVVLSCKD